MRRILGSLLILSAIATSAFSADETPWIGAAARNKTEGFTVYGVACGERYSALVDRLPPGWKATINPDGKTAVIQDRQCHLLLGLSESRSSEALIDWISIFPVRKAVSVEYDGRQVLKFGDTIEALEKSLGEPKSMGMRRYQFRKKNQVLSVSFTRPKNDDTVSELTLKRAEP